MSDWLQVGLVVLALVGLGLQLLALVTANLRIAVGCTCPKSLWRRDCPIHGRRS